MSNQNINIDVFYTGEPVYIDVFQNYGVESVNGRAGFVTLTKEDVGLSNVENLSITGVSGFLQYQIDQLDTGYASQVDIDLLSGNLISTGQNLQQQINNINNSGFITGVDLSSYYTKDNPSGFITGLDLSSYATVLNLASTGQTLNEKINNLSGVTVLTYGDQNISGTKSFLNSATYFGEGVVGKVIISEDAYGNEIGLITDNDEVIAVKMIDGSFQYGGGNPGSSPLSFLNEVGNFNNRPTVNGTGVLLSGEAAQLPNTIVYTTGNQTISGVKTFTNNTDFQQDISVSGFYNFDITNTGEPLDGQMIWNADYGTAQIGMDNGNVINPIGFKSFYRVKAAETIRKGKVVMALGGVGNSEYILAREAQNIANSGQLIMGVSAEEILANNYGDVVAFGSVRGVNTSNYPQDSILYYDTSSTGEFTHIPPQPPNAKVLVALNTTSANNGIVFVRVTAGSELGGTDSNVKFSTLQDNDFIKYNSASGYWENKQLTTGDVSGIDSYYLASNPSGFITGVDTSNFYTKDNPSGFVTNVNLQKFSFELSTGIETYTGSFNQTFSTTPSVVGTMQTTGDYMYMVGFNSITNSGFVADFSDIILESGVKLNIIAYDQQLV